MKFNTAFIVMMLFLVSCNNDKNPDEEQIEAQVVEEVKQQSTLEKIAESYGFQQWKNVNEVAFSFVVNPGEKEFERRWIWYPKLDKVSFVNASDTLSYQRDSIKEEMVKTDKAFVNDSFWLTFPFHLVWDEVSFENLGTQVSPILQKQSTKIKVNYPKDGGYTPGDSYEIYVDDNYKILEWTYHPQGQTDAALGNTFENQQSFKGIKIDMEHANPETGFQLNFRDVVIK